MTPKITWLHTAAAQVQAWDWALSHRSCESLSVTWSMIAFVKNSRASCPHGKFPPSFIHQKSSRTELVIRLYVLALMKALNADRA